MSIKATLRSTLRRNRFLVVAISAAFFVTMIMAAVVTYLVLAASPVLIDALHDWLQSNAGYVAIPPPYTTGLYRVIFLNNIGHFWNPIRFGVGYRSLARSIWVSSYSSTP